MNINTTKSGDSFELDLYIQKLFHEIQSLAYSDEDGSSKEDKFTEFVMERLVEAEETENPRVCTYIKEDRKEKIQFKINGYALEEGYESVDIFITGYKDINSFYRMNKSDFDNLIKWSTQFINAGLKGYLNDIEPSTEAYGLASILSKNRNDIIRVNIFLISNGEISHELPKNILLSNLDDVIIRFEIWDIERLHRLDQSNGNREPIEIDFEEMMAASIPCLEMPVKNDLYECYLAIVPGDILAQLYHNFGIRLLESNVRAFLQQTGKINKGIRDTIRKEPEMFLTYNNGLSSTAQSVKLKRTADGGLNILSVKDFQIVNGGQTTASLFHTKKKYSEVDLSKVFVPMKLTVIKDEQKKTEVVPYISRYANSQNKVTELDLSSNNIYLQKLEELSRTSYAINPTNRSKQSIWFFERVSGQYKEALNKEGSISKQKSFKLKYPKEQVLIKADVAKSINLWKLQPHNVSKGAQKNYISFMKEIEKENLTKKEILNKKVNRIYWEDIVANAILFRKTDVLFGRKNKNAIGDTNIKSHTVGYALSYFHYLTNNKLNLGKIWAEQTVANELLDELQKLLIYVYKFFENLDASLISEAAKSEKTWLMLKSKKDHPLNMEIVDMYLVSDEELKVRYETETDDSKELLRYEALQRVANLGLKFWDGLCLYIINHQIFSVY
ncbi:MAG: AIPR family protein, partial [Tannerellaceae bacterium]